MTALEFRIVASEQRFSVVEPIWLTLTLRNVGERPVGLAKFFMLPADDPGKNTLEIRVTDAAGQRVTRISHMLTGRALYHPQTVLLDAGARYQEAVQIAGTFAQKHGRKTIERALWNLGEDPAEASANEYPLVSAGTFNVTAVYHVDDRHLINLDAAERPAVWRGELKSNTTEIVVE
jgi:hypothetical protein